MKTPKISAAFVGLEQTWDWVNQQGDILGDNIF